MDEKRIQCWSNASQHISIYLQPFTSYRLLPRLLYGCEIWSLSSVNIRDLIIWNNCFRHVFNCCWRERVKPLRFYCNNLLLSYKKTVFFRKLFSSNNRVLRALITLPTVHYEILGLVSKYGIYTVHYSIASIKTAIWSCFVAKLSFSVCLCLILYIAYTFFPLYNMSRPMCSVALCF